MRSPCMSERPLVDVDFVPRRRRFRASPVHLVGMARTLSLGGGVPAPPRAHGYNLPNPPYRIPDPAAEGESGPVSRGAVPWPGSIAILDPGRPGPQRHPERRDGGCDSARAQRLAVEEWGSRPTSGSAARSSSHLETGRRPRQRSVVWRTIAAGADRARLPAGAARRSFAVPVVRGGARRGGCR